MQNATHVIQEVFDGALLLTGFFYMVYWMSGRKLTNIQSLILFAIGFAGLLGLNRLRSLVPSDVFLLVCLTPLWLRAFTKLLNSKPASQIKLLFARKPSALREKSES